MSEQIISQQVKSDAQLVKELSRAAEGLIFTSESDYPFETIRWDGADEISPAYLRRKAAAGDDAPVIAENIEQFLAAAVSEPEWKNVAEIALAKKYQSLARLLKENLTDVKAYKVGEINMPVYIVGKSRSGTWIGLSTRIVET